MNIKQKLAERIKELRLAHGMTAEILAWKGGLSKSNISNAEKGMYMVNFKTICGICKSLDISLAEFFSTFTDIEIETDEN